MADKKKKLKKNKDKLFNIEIEEGPRGNPAVVETYEDARENAMINRDVPTMKNGGNTVKPVKAVLGVLALGAAGAMGAKKLMKKKSNTVSSDDVKYTLKDKSMLTDLYQKATKQETSKMNKGGGMDMGKKKRYAKKNQEELFGIEITDEPQAGYTVKKTKNLSTGGDVTVGKGGDYIKDLID